MVEGQTIGTWFLDVSQQPEVGPEAYDMGATMLTEFFHQQLQQFLVEDLQPFGRRVIEACLDGAAVEDYEAIVT